jgi:hypothetical protein
MSNASDTTPPSYEGPLARIATPSSVSESDSNKENEAPIPIPPRTATPFSGESAIHTALGIETPQNPERSRVRRHLPCPPSDAVTSQRLVLLNLSVFGYLAFDDSLPSSTS